MTSLSRWIVAVAALVAAGVLTATVSSRTVAAGRLAGKIPHPSNAAAVTPARRYDVRGEIRGIEGSTVRIKHEAIPGYMAAMTMPFEVRDSRLMQGLRPGDQVRFELAVTDDDSWISRMERVSSAYPGPANISGVMASDVPRAQTGELVPDFTLVDQHDRPVRLGDFRGKAVLLTFVYTRCPLPNYCPMMSKNFASLQKRLQKEFPGRFHLLSVSIDPEFDRPDVLRDYASRYTADDSTWTFATGTSGQTDAVGALFGLVQERSGGLINHDLRTALIGPDGRLVHVWKSNLWTPYEVQRRVGEVLGR